MDDDRQYKFPQLIAGLPDTPNVELPSDGPSRPPDGDGSSGDDDDVNDDDDDVENSSLRDMLMRVQAQMGDMNTRLNQGLLTGTSLSQRLNVLHERIEDQQTRTTPDASTTGGVPDLYYRPGDKEDDYIERQLMRTEEPLVPKWPGPQNHRYRASLCRTCHTIYIFA